MTQHPGSLATADEASCQSIAEALQRYLDANPQACDDIEGVTRWWLAGEDVVPTPRLVERAMQMLGEAGRVSIAKSLSGKVLYSRGSGP
jgi:hypothetical protein